MEEAANCGARASSCSRAARGPAGRSPLTERLRSIAAEAGMVVCGANCMGFADVERGLRALAFEERADLEPGNVAWISHSGSAFSALARRRGDTLQPRRLDGPGADDHDGRLHALRAGARVDAGDLVFLETVRDPESFKLALETAAERDVPVVALKVGRTSTSRRLVTAHSGALAGDDAAYEALFDAYGVARVGTLNEMADLLELLGAGRRAAPGGRPPSSTPAESGRTWSTPQQTWSPSPGPPKRP